MSPRSSSQFEEMRQNSRKLILDAAFELFAQKGFHNTSIEQIRKKAGVSKGLIYNYFSTKEDLMKEVVLAQIEMGDEIVQEFIGLADPKAQLKKVVDVSLIYLTEKEEQIQLLIGLSLQVHDFPDLEKIIKARYQDYMPLFAGIFEKLSYPDPSLEAHFLTAYFDGLGLQKIVLGSSLDLEVVRDNLYKKYDLYHLSE